MPEVKMEDIGKIDQKYSNFTHATIDACPIFGSEAQQSLKIDDLNFVDEDVFIVETQKDGKFVFS